MTELIILVVFIIYILRKKEKLELYSKHYKENDNDLL